MSKGDFSKRSLQKRGWTNHLIETLLGDGDFFELEVPSLKSIPIYQRHKVLIMEEDDLFMAHQEAKAARRRSH